jgi:hypothetical protein
MEIRSVCNPKRELAYIFNSNQVNILEFDMDSEVATLIGDLHYGDNDDIKDEIVVSLTALYDGNNERVLLFG